MQSKINNLKAIARRCLAGKPLNRGLSRWLGTALENFLNHRTRSVDDALGLRFAQGGVPWWREAAIRKRDAALRQLAGHFYPRLCPSAQAKRIWQTSIRFAASAWRFDRNRENMPQHYVGKVTEYLWRAFKSGAAMPIGERQLRRILAK